VFPISGVTGQGVKELLNELYKELQKLPKEAVVFEPEFELNETVDYDAPIDIYLDDLGVYHIEGVKVDRMLGYTNIDNEKGFVFFQNFMKEQGILERLEEMGIEEGDTVAVYNLQFDYFK